MVFPVVMYGCKSWTIKKAECQRIYAFELWCWRRLLRIPWTARGSTQSNLNETNPEYSLEELMLKLKLQYFGHLIGKSWLTGKDPDAGKDWRQGEKGATEGEMVGWHHWLNGHELKQTPGDRERQGSLACCSSWSHRVRHDFVSQQQQLDCGWPGLRFSRKVQIKLTTGIINLIACRGQIRAISKWCCLGVRP